MFTQVDFRETLKQLGHFLIGAFAAICAAFIPRLAAIGPELGQATPLTVRVFTSQYVFTMALFAVLVGGVVLIFEWATDRTPREVFISALAIPALISGFVNSGAVANQAKQYAEERVRLATQRAEEEGIQILGAIAPVSQNQWLQLPSILPTVHAAGQSREQRPGQAAFGIEIREPSYWVTLGSAANQIEAEAKKDGMAAKYGELDVKKKDDQFFVVLAGPLPYSEAVAKAIAIKRESKESVQPALLGSGEK
jgi:hypothetical protein